jgi:hypothetical protein
MEKFYNRDEHRERAKRIAGAIASKYYYQNFQIDVAKWEKELEKLAPFPKMNALNKLYLVLAWATNEPFWKSRIPDLAFFARNFSKISSQFESYLEQNPHRRAEMRDHLAERQLDKPWGTASPIAPVVSKKPKCVFVDTHCSLIGHTCESDCQPPSKKEIANARAKSNASESNRPNPGLASKSISEASNFIKSLR